MASVNYKMTLKDYPSELQPRERLFKYGVQALTDRDLIALLLSTGNKKETALEVAEKILTSFGGLKGFGSLSPEELSDFHGVGIGKATRILAAIEVGKRIGLQGADFRPTISSPADVSSLVMEDMRHLDREHFKVLHLNTKNQVLSCETISIGNLNSSLVHPRELFKAAVKKSSAALILLHNHPSGDPTPSREDIEITKRLMDAGRLMGIEILDHVIIGDSIFYSMKEKAII